MTQKTFSIIGSGLAGCFLAVLLSEKGYKVNIYERLSKEEICDVASKRSYNITIYGYASEQLKKTGIWNDIEQYLLPLKGSQTHIAGQTKPVTNLIKKEMAYATISRAKFAEALLKKATSQKNVSIHYQTSLISIDRYDKTMILQNEVTSELRIVPTDAIIGADGANSLTRIFIQQSQQTTHTQEFASWNYKQFILAKDTADMLVLDRNFVHTWTQKKTFIIMHPNSTGGFSALLVFPKTIQDQGVMKSFSSIQTFFKNNFPDLSPGIKGIVASILENPDGYFATIHTDPWYYKDFITIIGDAAHGFYPFYGQGTTAAFGDCIILCKLLERYPDDLKTVFLKYQEERKKHTDALGELSKQALYNYLRFKKADYNAIYDKLETALHRLLPTLINPPTFRRVAADPDHADDYRLAYLKQRKIAKYMGFSVFVAAITGIASLLEKIPNKHD